jgi:serine O-acetyltransferase
MFDHLKDDVRRVTAGESTMVHRAVAIAFNLGFHAVLLYRLSHWLHRHHMSGLGLIVSYVNSVLTGAQISRRATIGKGLAILHPAGVVVGATTVIGASCTLVAGNTIGQLRGTNDRPCIGDHFYAGAGAKILGKITVGDHVNVGANSVVLHSLPDHVTSVGVPARIVSRRERITPYSDVRELSYDAILERLTVLLRGLGFPAESITPSAKVLDGGLDLDSIGVLQLACALEEEFHVSAESVTASSRPLRSLASLAALIQAQAAASSGSVQTVERKRA